MTPGLPYQHQTHSQQFLQPASRSEHPGLDPGKLDVRTWQPLPKRCYREQSVPPNTHSIPSEPQMHLQEELPDAPKWDGRCPGTCIVIRQKWLIHMTLRAEQGSHNEQILSEKKPVSLSQNSSCSCTQTPKWQVRGEAAP